MLIHFGQSSFMGHHFCAAGLFSVRDGIFLRRYCCLRSSDWMAVRIKKIRSDVMSCGMLSSTASLSEEAGNMTASAVTLGHVGAWEPLCHRAKIVNRVEQFAPRLPSHYSWGFLFFFPSKLRAFGKALTKSLKKNHVNVISFSCTCTVDPHCRNVHEATLLDISQFPSLQPEVSSLICHSSSALAANRWWNPSTTIRQRKNAITAQSERHYLLWHCLRDNGQIP